MARGTVKSVRDEGYGFIKTPESPDKDIFYHNSALTGELIQRKLLVGDEVEFEIEKNDRGPKAVNIRLAGAKEAEVETVEEAPEVEEVMDTEEESADAAEAEEPEAEAVA
jgi:cold shock CspA family protein